MLSTRRSTAYLASLVLVGGLLGLAACKPGGGASGGGGSALSKYEAATDFPMGSKTAKVVVVEYASVTCPHCANFHKNVLPALKEKYVTPGKVRYVFREYPTAPALLATAGHALARCAGGDKRDEIIATIMRQQMEMVTQAQGPTGSEQYFVTLGASVGMNADAVKACFSNEAVLKILADVKDGADKAGVTGTPAIFINGEKFDGPIGREMEAGDLDKTLDAALVKAG